MSRKFSIGNVGVAIVLGGARRHHATAERAHARVELGLKIGQPECIGGKQRRVGPMAIEIDLRLLSHLISSRRDAACLRGRLL